MPTDVSAGSSPAPRTAGALSSLRTRVLGLVEGCGVPVVEDGKPVGILTEQDMLRLPKLLAEIKAGQQPPAAPSEPPRPEQLSLF